MAELGIDAIEREHIDDAAQAASVLLKLNDVSSDILRATAQFARETNSPTTKDCLEDFYKSLELGINEHLKPLLRIYQRRINEHVNSK